MSKKLDASINQRFSSRWVFLLSVIGIAVGTGNIWRFPRIAAQNGSDQGAGAFLVAWVVFLFLWGLPLIIAEYALGRKYRTGVVATFVQAAGEKFAWMGAFVTFVATAITFFYSVVLGWCLYYFVRTLTGPPLKTTETATAAWNDYQSSPWPLVCHAVIMALGAMAIWHGIKSIERVNKVLIPSLLVIVLLCVVRALTLPGASEGIAYLFTPQWTQLLRPKVWMEALTQNAWDIGAGWGLYLTYAAYMKREYGVVKNGFFTCIGNNMVSLIAALMVFGTVFAVCTTEMQMTKPQILEIMRSSGPASTGLTFIWMPQLFARMFLGHPLAILFFLALTFAGFSSLIAQLELTVRVFIDGGMKRSASIVLVVGLSYLLGIPSARNLNILSNQDFVWGLALMLSGAFVAFMVIRYGIIQLRQQELTCDPNDWKIGYWWVLALKYFVPLAAVVLLIWWLVLSTIDSPGQWYNPFNTSSVMTCLVQWSVAIGIFILINRWMAKQMPKSTILDDYTHND